MCFVPAGSSLSALLEGCACIVPANSGPGLLGALLGEVCVHSICR